MNGNVNSASRKQKQTGTDTRNYEYDMRSNIICLFSSVKHLADFPTLTASNRHRHQRQYTRPMMRQPTVTFLLARRLVTSPSAATRSTAS